ncbi:MAG: branched-chain amino acid ABC transporter permease [Armatimonadota bacterium]|nr:branched-chain amino acid ABC transporter permease [Armatimonadota bacterium]MDR7450808.1 branched-chain amino acid ABC transporter permease [Armatimonadota bacterium]MDR7466164.1 branched-chain amino acid ABC transporter permease [Armatimonadota bacterium]MDR7493799.1 branched-chain amino acid ABC transporter permease [Armatimonadota bacterium]MDR7499040.1 branched-chain amino acid ABC transporter permease [Armatimonadota bacterium]
MNGILLQNAVFGTLVGGLYGLGAVGLSLAFGVLKMLNVAHGELIMLGGYVSVWLFALGRVDPFLSVLAAGPMLFLLGAALFWAFFRHLVRATEEHRIKNSILIGFGLALTLQTAAILAWTADEQAVTPPYAGAVIGLGPVVVPLARLGALALAFLLLGGLHLFLTRTRRGTAIRATAEDEQAAALVGIPIGRTYLSAFALASALAGVAGVLVSVSDAVSPAIGLHWTLKALIVIVLGGMGNILGTFVAGIFLGVVESMSGFLLGNAYREVVGLALFLLVLSIRPQGLFSR